MGIRISPYDKGCGAWGVRIATPACALVRNDRLFAGAEQAGGQRCPPLRRVRSRGAYGASGTPTPFVCGESRRRGTQHFHRNVIPRSEATWESVFPLTTRGAVRGEYGLPHQRARWFAMTGYLRVQSKRADRGVRPYGGCGAAAHTGRRGRRPLRSINKKAPPCKEAPFCR